MYRIWLRACNQDKFKIQSFVLVYTVYWVSHESSVEDA